MDRKVARCYNRILSGLHYVGSGDKIRLLTLTSALESKHPIKQSFRLLLQALRRRGIRLSYYSCLERSQRGLDHLHILYRGPYLYRPMIASLWQRIHGAPIVDIRATYGGAKRKANYLIKYLLKSQGDDSVVVCPAVSHVYDSYTWAPACVPELRKMWSYSWGWLYPLAVRLYRQAWSIAAHLRVQSQFAFDFCDWNVFDEYNKCLAGDQSPAKLLRRLRSWVGYPDWCPHTDEAIAIRCEKWMRRVGWMLLGRSAPSVIAMGSGRVVQLPLF